MPAPTITALPTQPGVAGPFSSDEADAFFGAVPDMITETNAQAIWRDIHDRITLINGLAAQDLASPPIWVTATSYARGDVVWSPADYFDYVRVIAGAGSTDPASDPTNWQRITGSGNATLTGAESWTNKTLKDATIQGALTEEVYTIVDGASVDIDPANGSIQLWTLGGARTPTATNFANGQEIALFIDGGGSAVTWSSIAPTWVNGITPTLTAGEYAVIVLSKRGGTFEGKYIGAILAPYLFSEGAVDHRLVFTRASTATRIDSAGLVASAAIDSARIDYDPATLAILGLLIEPQRTNLLLRSADFSNASWSKANGSVSTNAGTNPDGSSTVQTFTATSANAFLFQASDILTGNSGVNSIWIRRRTGSGTVRLRSLATGTDSPITVTSSWTRVTMPVTGNTGGNCFVIKLDTSGDAVDVWGAQLELGDIATSYIPTVASQVTRSADAASIIVPSGRASVRYTFDDDSTQTVSVSPGSYAIPTNLNRPRIKRIDIL